MIRWIIKSSDGKSGKRNGCSRISCVDSMISMYSVFVFLILSAQMTVVNIPTTTTIGYIAIAIHGHFKQGLAVKMSSIVCLFRDSAISGFHTSSKDDMSD
jgi:hypothetical protein